MVIVNITYGPGYCSTTQEAGTQVSSQAQPAQPHFFLTHVMAHVMEREVIR
jgi:hypothetical protein